MPENSVYMYMYICICIHIYRCIHVYIYNIYSYIGHVLIGYFAQTGLPVVFRGGL